MRIQHAISLTCVLVLGHAVPLPAQDGTPFVEKAKFEEPGFWYGWSVLVDGDTVFVGQSGTVLVFERSASGWSTTEPVATLSQSGLAVAPPSALAKSGDTLAAGYTGTGVFIYEKPAGGWVDMTETAKLTAPFTPYICPIFGNWIFSGDVGYTVSIDGDTVVAGAPNQYPSGGGVTFVWEKPPSGWVDMHQPVELRIGWAIGIHDDTVAVVGGRRVLLYDRPVTGWEFVGSSSVRLRVDNPLVSSLGGAIAFDGGKVVVGATDSYVQGKQRAGQVVVWEKPASGWVDAPETARLWARRPKSEAHLGKSVACSGDVIVAGADGYLGAVSRGLRGEVYVFHRPASGWANTMETARLTASDGQAGDGLGASVSIDGQTIVATSPRSSATGAYVFAMNETLAGSGCGGAPLGFAGSTRIGGTLFISNPGCGPEPTHGRMPAAGVAIGVPTSTPIQLGPPGECGTDRPCELLLRPTTIAAGPTHAFNIEFDPSLVGTQFSLQGICIDLPCVRTTDLVTVTISR